MLAQNLLACGQGWRVVVQPHCPEGRRGRPRGPGGSNRQPSPCNKGRRQSGPTPKKTTPFYHYPTHEASPHSPTHPTPTHPLTPPPLTHEPHPHSPMQVVEVEVDQSQAIQVRNIRRAAAIATAITFIVQFGYKKKTRTSIGSQPRPLPLRHPSRANNKAFLKVTQNGEGGLPC